MVDDCGSKDETPQLENGYVRFSTEWLEEFLRADYPGALKEFVFAVARETWGWGETWREITVPRLCEILGVSVVRIKQLREEAAYLNLIEWEPGNGPTCAGRYRVQKDFRNWIPRRTTGAWARRHEVHTTGQDVVTGHSDLTGKDVVTSNRLRRPNRSLYIGVKDSSKEKDIVRIGENDLAARTISPDPVEEKQQQQAAKAKRDADRLRQQTEKLDAALAALSQPDRDLLDTMLAGQQIAKGKPLTLLQQATQADIYARELTEHGPECWRDCCRLSCEKQIYTAEYARGCTKHWTPSGGNGNGRGRLPPQGQLTELDRMQLQADYEREEAVRRGDQRTTAGTRDPRPTL